MFFSEKKRIFFPKINFFAFLFSIIFLIIITLTVQYHRLKVSPRAKTAEPADYLYELTKNYEITDSPDWETSENYLYTFIPQIKTDPSTTSLSAKVDLYYEGSDLTNYSKLYLYSVNQQAQPIVLSVDPANRLHYSSDQFPLSQGVVCLDIFTTEKANLDSYRGTFCLRAYYIIPPTQTRIYSPGGKFFLDLDIGGKPVGFLTMGTVFDRSSYFHQPTYSNKLGEKVVFFTYDTSVQSVSFNDLKYNITPMIPSDMPDNLRAIICGNKEDPYFQPQLHQVASRALPQGGNFYSYTKKTDLCSFEYRPSFFTSGFLSHSPLVRKKTVPFPSSPPSPLTTLSPSGFGKALKITKPESYVKIPASLTIRLQSNFTVEGWIKIDDNPQMRDTNPHYFVSKEAKDGEGPGYALGVTNRKAEFRIFLLRGDQQPANVVLSGETTLEFNRWYHVAGVVLGNTMYLLVNGQLDGKTVISQGGYGYEPENRLLTFGCARVIDFPACVSTFYGEIDEIRLSRTARILPNLFPPEKPYTPDEFTQALWHFDDNVKDESGNGNHGEIVGEIKFVDSTVPGRETTPLPITSPPPLLTPTKTPTPWPSSFPPPKPSLTLLPTKKPLPTIVQKYHTECRRFFFRKYCVSVKGPGINQCRTSKDCR